MEIKFLVVGFDLQIDPGNDFVNVQGKLPLIKIFRIRLVYNGLKQFVQIIIPGYIPNGCPDGFHISRVLFGGIKGQVVSFIYQPLLAGHDGLENIALGSSWIRFIQDIEKCIDIFGAL